MLSSKVIKKIKDLKNSGHSNMEVSRASGISYPTVTKYLNSSYSFKDNEMEKDKTRVSKLVEPFIKKISELINSGIRSSKKIEILLRNEGYKGSYQLLNAYIKSFREKALVENTDSYFRVETNLGEQAQVDWGHFGKIVIDGRKLNLYVFVFVLSNSRAVYAKFVTSQKQKVLQDCHVEAFKYLGGIPNKIRYDNMKTVIVNRIKGIETGEEIRWNFEFKNFANYYKFQPEVCPRYYPRAKGKVEAAVKFIRMNFFDGEIFNKTFYSLDELNIKLNIWLTEYANRRKHPIHEESVYTFWQKEKEYLSATNEFEEFSNIAPQIRRVSRISMISYKKAFYWVPKEYIRHKVEIREVLKNGQTTLEFHTKEKLIYEHTLAPQGSWILPDHRELIKTYGKGKSLAEKVTSNPLYKTRVETRKLDYYSKLINL